MIDSRAKRASLLGVIWPDGTIDQGDRQTTAGVYRGILAMERVLADGLARIAWAITHPGIAFDEAVPGIAMTGAAPGISMTGRRHG
jgi:hypothetical protein